VRNYPERKIFEDLLLMHVNTRDYYKGSVMQKDYEEEDRPGKYSVGTPLNIDITAISF
jgi:hypothetical protein